MSKISVDRDPTNPAIARYRADGEILYPRKKSGEVFRKPDQRIYYVDDELILGNLLDNNGGRKSIKLASKTKLEYLGTADHNPTGEIVNVYKILSGKHAGAEISLPAGVIEKFIY